MVGAASHVFSAAVDESTAVDVDANNPVTIQAINIINFTASNAIAYAQFFKVAAAGVTVGTTAPDFVIPLPADSGLAWNFANGWLVGGAALSVAVATTRTGNGAADAEICIVY